MLRMLPMLRRLALLFLLPLVLLAPARASLPQLIQAAGAETPIRLSRVSVNAEISGSMAQTTVEMVFTNPNARQLEGTLQFPLLEGQQITGFALDVEDTMRAAVPVEKAKGRQVFEEIERRRVDPALLEQTRGNNFQLRIYPVPAKGKRTVRLTFSESLARRGADWTYRLPLDFAASGPSFHLRMTVQGGAAPVVDGPLRGLKFIRKGSAYEAEKIVDNMRTGGTVELSVPAIRQARAYVQEHGGETYFLAEIPVEGKAAPRALPKVVGLLWDSSGSGRSRALEAEIAVLDRYFRAIGNGEVRLIRLRDRAEPVETFRIVNGDWNGLQGALRAVRYDGATALGKWQPQADVEEYLLMSDGLDNYGKVPFPALASGQRLHAISSAVSADTARLRALAERSGGTFVQVSTQRPGDVAAALLVDGPQVQSLSATGANELQVDSRRIEGRLLRVAGKLTGAQAELRVMLSHAGRKEIVLPIRADAPAHPQAARQWALYKLRLMEADYENQRASIRRIGQQFSLPTRETSLIVLDNIVDYIRYEIEPPEPYLAAYHALREFRGAQLIEKRQKNVERVVAEFRQKVAWWEKAYPKDAPPKKEEAKEDTARSRNPEQMAARELQAREAAQRERAQHERAHQDQARRALAPAPAPPAPPSAPAPAPAPASSAPVRSERSTAPAEAVITLKKWSADAPYIARLKEAAPENLYAIYLDEKPGYENSSAFYLDAADILFDRNQRDLALRVLSNLAEMQLENRHVLRILAYRLLQAGAPELAVPVLREVLRLGEEEPQSFRDLGLAYAAAGEYQKAIDALHEVILRPWDGRFAEIELVALGELNALVATSPVKLDTSRIDPRLLKNLPLDLRVVLTWDADNSDMDLWVTDPNGEKSYYGNRLTYQGGRMSRDFTAGYGPEEFLLRFAKPGKYKVEANFYGNRQQTVAGATTLQLQLTTGFGTTDAKSRMVTLRLSGRGDMVQVGEFEVAGTPAH